MEIDLTTYLKAAITGVPLLFLVFGIVEVMKRLKRRDGSPTLTGNAVLLASLAWGIVLGLGYAIAQTEPPQHESAWVTYVYWFGCIAYGLGLGILAAIFFEALKAIVLRAVSKIFGLVPPADPPPHPYPEPPNPLPGG